MDMTRTIAARSDQINADDLLGGPATVTITDVTEGNSEQPVNVIVAETPGRAYKPSKSMRRVMVAAWGRDSAAYIGQRLTLFRNPEITFGRDKVGGIEISHMSGLSGPLVVPLTVKRGKRQPFTVQPLPDAPPAADRSAAMLSAFADYGITENMIAARLGRPRDQWTGDDITELGGVFNAVKDGTTSPSEAFPNPEGDPA